MRSLFRGLLAILAILALQATSAPLAWSDGRGGGDHDRSLVVVTQYGALAGNRDHRVESFKGVPYAASAEEFRWQPPQPVKPWAGIRSARELGNVCPQPASDFIEASDTEDCLFLNIYRPAGTSQRAKLPVFVFIHGGGLFGGSANQFDGGALATETGMIVVAINYRVGVLGFLAHSALEDQGAQSGNYGLMDQQAALSWVKENISAFGGNPRKVTIGGQSAGGWSVCAHLVSPGSTDLFAQALIQSGSCLSQSREEATGYGSALAEALNCTDPVTAAACLRAVPVDQLLTAPNTLEFGFNAMFVRGSEVLPTDPRAAIADGSVINKVPVLVGANRDEFRSFLYDPSIDPPIAFADWDEATFDEAFVGYVGADVLAEYPWSDFGPTFTGSERAAAIFTDRGELGEIGGCPNRSLIRDLAEITPTYAYEFDHRKGPGQLPVPVDFAWGAGHGAELADLFPSFVNGEIAETFDPNERRLATSMKQWWGSFVSRGVPRAAGQNAWPTFNGTEKVFSIHADKRSAPVRDSRIAEDHHCSFWDNRTEPVGATVESDSMRQFSGTG